MAVIFTPSFKKAPPASLPPCFSFCFLCSLYFFWFSAQFTLPPITPPFLCSPPLIYCCFRWEREEDATAFFFSSLCCVYISLLALFLLPHTSPGLCLLNLPPFPPPACFGCLSSFWMLIRDTWLRWRSYLPGRGKNRRRRRGQSFFTIIWAFLTFKTHLKQSMSSHFDRMHQRKRLRLCLHGIWTIWLLRDLIFHRTSSYPDQLWSIPPWFYASAPPEPSGLTFTPTITSLHVSRARRLRFMSPSVE